MKKLFSALEKKKNLKVQITYGLNQNFQILF